jgi:hypothetical protein
MGWMWHPSKVGRYSNSTSPRSLEEKYVCQLKLYCVPTCTNCNFQSSVFPIYEICSLLISHEATDYYVTNKCV